MLSFQPSSISLAWSKGWSTRHLKILSWSSIAGAYVNTLDVTLPSIDTYRSNQIKKQNNIAFIKLINLMYNCIRWAASLSSLT